MLVETITQFVDHIKVNIISQLIKDISKVLQKLLKYFSGTNISTFFVPLSPVWPVIFASKLNESVRLFSAKLTIALLLSTAGISLQYCHKLPDFFE